MTTDQHYCGTCGGPVLTWKGSVHGWTCGGCLDRYIAEQIARHDAAKGAEYAMAT